MKKVGWFGSMRPDNNISIKAVIWIDGKALLLRNPRGELELAGGRIEMGETPFDTLKREAKEELGVPIECGQYVKSGFFEVVPGRYVFLEVFECSLNERAEFTLSDEHHAVELVPIDELDKRGDLPQFYLEALMRSAEMKKKRG